MKNIYKIIQFTFIAVMFFFAQNVFAAELHLSADKNSLNTDEIVSISLSVDGQIDDSQVTLSGLDNFDIVGRSSSQKVSIINGQTTVLQEQIFSLQPLKSGQLTIKAVAKENGTKITSDKITLTVTKSLLQSTKDKLLRSNGTTTSNTKNSTANNKKEDIKKLLTLPQDQQQGIKQEKQKDTNLLNIRQISVFNSWFWLELFGIIFLLLGSIFIISLLKKKG